MKIFGSTVVDDNGTSAEVEENFVAGMVGSLLFSLAGVVLWFVIYQIGYIAGITGIVTVICAIKGYEVFGKLLSIKGLITSIVVSIVMIFVSEYICIGYEIYTAFHQEYNITIFDAIRSIGLFLQEEEIRGGFIRDLVMGYGFALVGSVRYIISAWSSFRKNKAMKAMDE